MKLLLDANAFIWAYNEPSELSAAARRAISDSLNERFISIVALWEIAIKQSIGKIGLLDDFDAAVADLVLEVMPVTLSHITQVRRLPLHHRDPFDRMMIAQAIEEGLTIVTRDRQFEAYGVPLLKA